MRNIVTLRNIKVTAGRYEVACVQYIVTNIRNSHYCEKVAIARYKIIM